VKKPLLIFGGVVLLLILFFLLSPDFAEKRGALGASIKTLVTADHHHALVAEGGTRVLKADHNLAVITRANRYIATFGSQTSVYRKIAEIAAAADHECPLLEEVLDLAVRSVSDVAPILELAEKACWVDSPEDEAIWREVYDMMEARAAYPTVEIAEEKQGEP
jgi:hypothetical protein